MQAVLFTASNSMGYTANQFISASFAGLAFLDWVYLCSMSYYLIFVGFILFFMFVFVFRK
jgi:hypothetical protein